MQNKKMKNLLAMMLTLIMIFVTGCSGDSGNATDNGGTTDNTQTEDNTTNDNQDSSDMEITGLSGSINAGGSTSVESAALATLEEFQALNPEVTFVYDATGSSTGIKNAKDGTYKLGFASRDLKEEEKDGITYEAIALDGIALAVNPANGVADLTLEQVKGIYTGAITNWSELGGTDAAIVVVSRESGSGTRGAFEEIVGFEDALVESAIIKNGNGEVATYLTSEPNAIGYISFTTLESNSDSVKGLTVNGANADVASVQDGTYPISRPFMMVYDEANLNDAEKAFIEFIFSAEGQDIIEDTGAIKVGGAEMDMSEPVATIPTNVSGDINAGGSTSVESAALATLEEFQALNPDVTFVYDATGSSTGIKNAKDGTYKLGFASRDLKEEEKDGITYEAIALDGIALAVNPANGVADLTLDQVLGIYTGTITNWSELGGADAAIVVVSRESGSGTRGAFEEIVGFEDALVESAIIKNGNGEVATYLTSEPNAIGYISFTTLEANSDSVKGLTVDGANADVASVQDGTYPISRPFMMVYDEAGLNDAEKAFVQFLFSAEGQDIIEDTGAIRVN